MVYKLEVGNIPAAHRTRGSLIFHFYCDLSYDGSPREKIKGKPHDPRTYVFAGITGHEDIWNSLKGAWGSINTHFGVSRFHASHLNGKTHEYDGWDDERKTQYSRSLLRLLAMCGRELGVVGSGMFADAYREVISPSGRAKLGTPYVACFNSCITGLAMLMANNKAEDRFTVIMDKDEGWEEAQASFYWLKEESNFAHRHRLLSCTSMSMDDAVCLQVADLVAYEIFKGIEKLRSNKEEVRFPMKSLLKHNLVREGFFDKSYLEKLKPWIESTTVTGRYLVHTPSFENYTQMPIPEELDNFSTIMDLILKADPQVATALMKQEKRERD